MLRHETKSFKVGNLTLGGNQHVIIQSMCNTKTKDTKNRKILKNIPKAKKKHFEILKKNTH